MSAFDGCEYCIPNKNNEVRALMVNHHFAESHGHEKHSVDTITIARDLRHSYQFTEKEFRLQMYRKIHISDTKTKEHVVPNMKEIELGASINICPVCGRKLTDDIPKNHPLLTRQFK